MPYGWLPVAILLATLLNLGKEIGRKLGIRYRLGAFRDHVAF
jgi:hypothetical protein